MSNPQAFAAYLEPLIKTAAAETGLDPVTVAIQWGEECGWSFFGCNQGHAGQDGVNNYGGIMAGDTVANFATRAEFVAEYVRTINSYKAAMPPLPDTVTGQCEWLGKSPYNGTHHYLANGVEGGILLTLAQDFGAELDATLTPAPPAPAAPSDPDTLDLTISVAGYGTGHLVFHKPSP